MSKTSLNEEAIFDIARGIDSADTRTAYIRQACAGDEALLSRVEELLRLHHQERSFIESPPKELDATENLRPITEKPGDVLGPYKLLQQIGDGGFGVVYMAEQSRPVRRKVALKVIKPGMDTKEVIARFEAERQALAMMDHPNIAKVLDAGETESGRPYYRLSKFVHRNRGTVTAAVAVAGALLLGIIGTTTGMFQARRDAVALSVEVERSDQLARTAQHAEEIARRAESEERVVRIAAQKAMDAERVARLAAEQQEQQLQEQSYFQLIQLTQAEMANGRPGAALRLLDDCPKPLRHWEWSYLHRLACSDRLEPATLRSG